MSWISNFFNKSEKNSFVDKQTKLKILEQKDKLAKFRNYLNKSENNSFANKQNRLDILEDNAQTALDKGDAEPAFLLGNTFNDVDDPFYIKNPPYDVCKHNTVKAKYWLEKAMKAGHPDAMVVMGTAYCVGGAMVEKDFKYGLELIKKAKSIGTNPPHMADMALNSLLNLQMNKVFGK